MSLIYHEAASILRQMDKEKRGVRDVFYNRKSNASETVQKQTFALVCNISRYSLKLKQILKDSNIIAADFKWSGNYKKVNVPGFSVKDTEEDAKNTSQIAAVEKKGWSKKRLFKKSTRQKGDIDPYMCLVISWDFLFGQGIKSGGNVAKIIQQNSEILMKCKLKYFGNHFNDQNKENSNEIYKYIRVNLSKISREKAKKEIETYCNKKVKSSVKPSSSCSLQLENDKIFSELLILKDSSKIKEISTHSLFVNGTVVLQDKSTCVATIAAEIEPGMSVLDVCSAPGSKTLHIIDRLKGSGRIISVEKDPKRGEILMQRLKLSGDLEGPFGCPCCRSVARLETEARPKKRSKIENNNGDMDDKPIVQRLYLTDRKTSEENNNNHPKLVVEIWICDFLQLTSSMLQQCCCVCSSCPNYQSLENVDGAILKKEVPLWKSQIDRIILDPSCSGSGLQLHQVEYDANRCHRLSTFQKKMLQHIFNEFAYVQIICYSTCSIFIEENERVISDIYQSQNDFKLLKAMPAWTTRELEYKSHYMKRYPENDDQIQKLYDLCFHSHPQYDNCRGFFLAKFRKTNHS